MSDGHDDSVFNVGGEARFRSRITPADIVRSVPLSSGIQTLTRFQDLRFNVDPTGLVIRGKGAFSIVLEATLSGGDEVAVKLYRGGDSDQTSAVVAREWKSAQEDLGRNIVRAHACHLVRDAAGVNRWIMIMDLVQGPTLHQLLGRGAHIPQEIQQAWLRSGLTTLAALASRRSMRDVKPANVGLSSTDPATADLVLLDHGFAKDELAPSSIRGATYAYAAPELILNADHLTPKVDLFSLGVTLLEVFTHGKAFDTPASNDSMRCLDEAPHLDHPSLAPEVARILKGALVKHPDLRPSAAELLYYLNNPVEPTPNWDPDRALRSRKDLTDPGAYDSLTDATADDPRQRPPRPASRPSTVTLDDEPAPPPARPERMVGAPLYYDPEPGRFSRLAQMAGIDSQYIKVHRERVLYGAAGLMLIAYSVYAVIGVIAMAYMVTDGSYLAIPGAIVMGAIIATIAVSLDRVIISAIPVNYDRIDDPEIDQNPIKYDRRARTSFVVRIAIALLFAFTVSEPVNLLIFNKDVTAAIGAQASERLEAATAAIDASFLSRFQNQEAIKTLAVAEQTRLQAEPAKLLAQAELERKGQGPTGQAGCGVECKGFLREAEAARKALPVSLAAQQKKIDAADTAIVALNTAKGTEITQAEAQFAADNGFFAREREFLKMLQQNPTLLLKYLAIAAVLVIFEMAGVLTKVISRGNNYERDMARLSRHIERCSREGNLGDKTMMARRGRGNVLLQKVADDRFYAAHGVTLPSLISSSTHRLGTTHVNGERVIHLPESEEDVSVR